MLSKNKFGPIIQITKLNIILGPCSLFEMFDEEDGTCTSVVKDNSKSIDWGKVTDTSLPA